MASDTPKQFVGGPTDHDMTEEEALEFGRMLFDAIGVERSAQSQEQQAPSPEGE